MKIQNFKPVPNATGAYSTTHTLSYSQILNDLEAKNYLSKNAVYDPTIFPVEMDVQIETAVKENGKIYVSFDSDIELPLLMKQQVALNRHFIHHADHDAPKVGNFGFTIYIDPKYFDKKTSILTI